MIIFRKSIKRSTLFVYWKTRTRFICKNAFHEWNFRARKLMSRLFNIYEIYQVSKLKPTSSGQSLPRPFQWNSRGNSWILSFDNKFGFSVFSVFVFLHFFYIYIFFYLDLIKQVRESIVELTRATLNERVFCRKDTQKPSTLFKPLEIFCNKNAWFQTLQKEKETKTKNKEKKNGL